MIPFLLLLIAFGIFAGEILFVLFMGDSILCGHDLATSRRAIKKIAELILNYKGGRGAFYDLGCGRGTLALALKKQLPDLTVHGVDKSGLRLFFARLKAKLLRREIVFERRDIFAADLHNADVVYAYLWYDLMAPLETKLLSELKPGALIIANTSSFPRCRPSDIIDFSPPTRAAEKLFIYVRANFVLFPGDLSRI